MKLNKKIVLGTTLGVLATTLTGCASWDRAMKDWDSEMGGGLPRKITVYDINGKKIFEDKGKFDIRRDEKSLQYVDDNNNRKHNIYFGDNNAVIVKEISESELRK